MNIKDLIMNKLANGISDFTTGFNENKNNAFMPSNLTDNKFSNGENKGFIGRIGEATGTIGRLLDKPATQGIVGGILNGVLTGSPMYGLIAGSGMASQKANSDVYAKALQEQGINVPTGLFNSYDENDLSALMQPQYKQQELEMKKLHEEVLNKWRQAQAENTRYKNETDRNYKENRIINDTKKIENKTGNEVDKQAYQTDLSKVTDVLSNPKYSPEDKINAIKYLRQKHSKLFKASDIKDIEKLNDLLGNGNNDLRF